MSTNSSRRKVATETGLYLIVLAAIVVVANVFSAGASKRWDATANDRYTLSEGSKRLVQSLKEPMQVDAYVTRGLARLEVYVDDLNSLLSEYEAAGANFKYTLIEAKTDELKQQAKDAGLQPMQFASQADTGDDGAAIQMGYLGIVIKYGSEKGTVPLDPRFSHGLEFLLTNKIREIRDKADEIKHRIGVVTGKDELKLTDTNLMPRQGGGQGGANLKGILDQYFPFYEIVDVELKADEPIDATLAGLIVTQPQKDYTEEELRRIDEFVMLGGKALTVIASAVNIKPNDPQMKATFSTHGLEKLVGGYGMNLQNNLLLDYGAQFQIIVPAQGGFTSVRHPPVAHVADDPRFEEDERTLDTTFASFFRLNEAAFPYPSSIELLKDKQPADVTIKAVARTTPNTTIVTDESIDLTLKQKGWEPKPPFEQHVIAAVAEGKLKSAFAGSEDNKGIDVPETAPEPSRVLLIASSQFITNPFAYSGNGPELGGQFAMFGNVGGDQTLIAIAGPYAQRYMTNTILGVKNTLDWMTGDQDLLEVSAKIIQDPNLKYAKIDPKEIPVDATEEELKKIEDSMKAERKNTQKSIEWTLTLGIPFLFGLFGLFRWRTRNVKQAELKLA